MNLTPRQMFAYLEFSARLDRMEQANDLAITSAAVGAQSKEHKQAVEKAIKELGG